MILINLFNHRQLFGWLLIFDFLSSFGVTQINKGMEELNNLTQTNAASSEDLYSTSEILNNETLELQNKISFFKIE